MGVCAGEGLGQDSDKDLGMDENTKETLRIIREQLDLGQEVDEDIDWEDLKHDGVDLDYLLDKLYLYTASLKEKVYKKFKKSREIIQEILPENRTGDELTRELEDAWNLYSRGGGMIPSKDIGQVLRILGQNPTEDQVVEMVMKANCEWDGYMRKSDFLGVGLEIVKAGCDQMEDVRAAFKVFDHNNDGSISREELREAMVNLGTRCTDEEFAAMFADADKNDDGKIDFDEFSAMMVPAVPGHVFG